VAEAVKSGQALQTPTVGTWQPRIGRGAPLAGGLVLGALYRAGEAILVVAPEGAGGVAVKVAEAGAWVEYGASLVEMGEGAFGGLQEEPIPTDEAEASPGIKVLRAETDGTVYLRPDPASPSFAAAGTEVSAHQTVALIEVMKTFNAVRSPVAGIIERVLVDDAVAVAAGDPLLWLRPSGPGTA